MKFVNGYFDWASTSLPDKKILENALKKSFDFSANPSSVHKKGIEAKTLLNNCRIRCAKILDVKEDTIIFTSGGTESNCIPIVSLLQRPSKGSIVISAIEHPAIREQANAMKNSGWRVNIAKANKDGIITPEAVVNAMDKDTALVCVMAVNNETGAIQPIEEISKAISESSNGRKRPKFHVDAVQSIGKTLINLNYNGIDTVAISAHKLYGPRGVGILYMKNKFEPFLKGGGQEYGLRSGTENIFGILALTECLEKYCNNEFVNANIKKMTNVCNDFINEVLKIKGTSIVPPCREKIENTNSFFSPYILQVAFQNIPGEVMVRALSEKGFYISTGSACSSKKQSRPILQAMQTPAEIALNSVRFSFSQDTTFEQTSALLDALKSICSLFN